MTSQFVSQCASLGTNITRTMRNSLNLSGGTNGLIGGEATLGVDQVGCEDGIDQSRFAEAGLSCAH